MSSIARGYDPGAQQTPTYTINTPSQGKGSPISFIPQPIRDPLATGIPDKIAEGVQQAVDEGIVQPTKEGIEKIKKEIEESTFGATQDTLTIWAVAQEELRRLQELEDASQRYNAMLANRQSEPVEPEANRRRGTNISSGEGLARPTTNPNPLGTRFAQLGPRRTVLSGGQSSVLGG